MIKARGKERVKENPVSTRLEETNVNHDTSATLQWALRFPSYPVVAPRSGHVLSASASPTTMD